MSRLTLRCARTCARNFACWSNASCASTATRRTSRRRRRRRCWSRLRFCPPGGRLETMSAYARYIGIDYSDAETPSASRKGLRVYLAEGDALPVEVAPPPSPRKYWTRRGIAIDAIGNGRVMNDHRPWPRRVADSDLWCSLAEQFAEGRWTLFGLWSDLDAVHTALLDEVANRAAAVTHE